MPPPKNQKQDSLDSIIEMVSRNDEKMKNLIENHTELSNDLLEIRSELNNVKSSLESYKLKLDNLNSFWERIFDSGWKIALMVIGGAILYFLRLQSPPN